MRRGYYIADGDPVTEFPVTERPDGEPDSIEESDVDFEAQSGRTYVDKQFSRGVMTLNFWLTEAQKEFFRELHVAVGGREIPFYFVLDVSASPQQILLVRKEKDFRPRRLRIAKVGGVRTTWWEYTLTLTEQVDDPVTIEE